ncbi:MAG: hypothetical protein ABI702_01520 [Burkholderiales bacterium]
MLADRQPDALARLVDEVAEVVVARQPDAALEHRQFAAEAAQLHGLAGDHTLGTVPIELRIHHQSPVWGEAIIGSVRLIIQ